MILTPEEERLVRIVEGKMCGENIQRILIKKAPRTVRGLLDYADFRLEDLLKTLMDMEFCEDIDRTWLSCVTPQDVKKHLAERCLEGLHAADQYYRNKPRM